MALQHFKRVSDGLGKCILNCSYTSENGIVTVKLAAVLDNMVAEELCDVWRDVLNGDPGDIQEINIDAGRVDRISTPCVQVILSAVRSAGDHQVPAHMTDTSDAVQAAFSDLGLTAELYALNKGLK